MSDGIEMDASVRTRVVQLFEKHRATPGAPYDDVHLLDFLLPEPTSKGAVYNSFTGLRRFNAFLDDVQYEFAVCLSMEDRDANYALDRFVDRVLVLQQSRRGSLKSLNNQVRAGLGWQVVVVADFILLFAAAWARDKIWVLAAIGTIAILVNAWFVWFAWRAKAYLLKLRARIEGAPE